MFSVESQYMDQAQNCCYAVPLCFKRHITSVWTQQFCIA